MVDASVIFSEGLSNYLEELGFKRDPYDWCVMNKTINGEQCTIVWHVDDLMINHLDPDVVTSVIDGLSEKYGKTAPLTVDQRKVHEYLGMVINFNDPGAAKVAIYQYIYGVIDSALDVYRVSFREHGVGKVTPAPSNLYEIRSLDT